MAELMRDQALIRESERLKDVFIRAVERLFSETCFHYEKNDYLLLNNPEIYSEDDRIIINTLKRHEGILQVIELENVWQENLGACIRKHLKLDFKPNLDCALIYMINQEIITSLSAQVEATGRIMILAIVNNDASNPYIDFVRMSKPAKSFRLEQPLCGINS